MKEKIKWVKNAIPKSDATKELALMNVNEVEKARKFHESFPQYTETPLVALDNLAKDRGVAGIYVKDESYRFGLNAFKVLGGSYAIGNFIAKSTGRDISELGYDKLVSPETKKELGEFTFFSTTDGNHGRGVAWAANQMGQKSVIYMPKGSSQIRLDNIRKEGAKAEIVDMNYDDAVRMTAEESAKTPQSVIVQDTAWEGYEEIPSWIMQGYGTMAIEAANQLKKSNVTPTHVIVQAGVGSLAGAVQGFVSNYYKENPPITIVVEAEAADCLYRSAVQADGKAVNVGGDLTTIMAGLACGEANTISWEILKNYTDFFVSLPDYAAAKGMRTLSSPIPGDTRVISGESGAAGFGLLMELLENPEYSDFRQEAKIDANSKILLFSTEGDTDPDRYRSIVWDGEFPSF